MSTQKGNITRTRPQKFQNKTKFKNSLHDTSHTTKFINSLEIDNVCARCKSIIEWKIKYKKYKPLKSPATCVKCHNKNVKHAYHTMCLDCSKKFKVCPKCGLDKELVAPSSKINLDKILELSKVQEILKSLPERKRRTFYRFVNNPECDLSTEETVLQKLNELSLSGSGKCYSSEAGNSDSEFDSDDDFEF